MAQPNQTYIDTYISDGLNATVNMRNLYDTILTSSVNNRDHVIRVPTGDFFLKYRTELAGIIQQFVVPEKWFYQPKTVSLELYGTTELWLSLLRLNDMINTTEFHLPIIKIYNPSALKEYIKIFFKREKKS